MPVLTQPFRPEDAKDDAYIDLLTRGANSRQSDASSEFAAELCINA